MPLSTASDQLRLARLHASKTARGLAGGLARPFSSRPRRENARGETLCLVLRDMRPPDMTFFGQARRGVVQLGGETFNLGPAGLFDARRPTEGFRKQAHSFGWLNDLRAAEVPEAAELMRSWTVSWLNRSWHADEVARCPVVSARRVISWLAHADVLLDDVEEEVYDAFMEALVAEISVLAAKWQSLPRCVDRAIAGLALIAGAVAVPCCRGMVGQVRSAVEGAFCEVVAADGSPVSRNATDLVDILFAALPVASACTNTETHLLPVVAERCNRARAHLQMMRLGDNGLARFHGVCGSSRAELARLGIGSIGLGLGAPHEDGVITNGGFVRLEAGRSILIADVASAPPVRLSGSAHASCLAFEISSGNQLVLVNTGVPTAPFATSECVARGRATASHTALTLGNQSSSRRVQETALKHFGGGEPIIGPEVVSYETGADERELRVTGSHNGYCGNFGVHHTRELRLSRDGSTLVGRDRIGSLLNPVRFSKDVPFAIHFHIHPLSKCVRDDRSVQLHLPNGETWLFSCKGVRLGMEESTFYADPSGPKPSRQIVLRGTSHGETTIEWAMRRLES